MMRAVQISLLSLAIILVNASNALSYAQNQSEQASVVAPKESVATNTAELDRLREEGNTALYNTDYKTAEAAYNQMKKLAPDHPAVYVYLANNLWLETLFMSRRLSTTLYSGGSFYETSGKGDKSDPARDKEFESLIKQAMDLTRARLQKNSKDTEALYYQASALGLRAAYETTVRRSFMRAIGDANDSIQIQKQVVKIDPNFTDAYMSIGLYEYVIDSLPFLERLAARAAGLKGSKKKGIEHLEMVVKEGKYTSDDARVLLIGIYTREGKPELALSIITELAQKYPRNYLFGVERANMLYRMGRGEEGDKAFADLLKEPRIAENAYDIVHSQWGDALMTKGNYDEALKRFKEVKQWPKSERGLKTLARLGSGQAYESLSKPAEATAEYEAVLKEENIYDSHKQANERLKALRSNQTKKK
jgi:predicted Zn-dependent protease